MLGFQNDLCCPRAGGERNAFRRHRKPFVCNRFSVRLVSKQPQNGNIRHTLESVYGRARPDRFGVKEKWNVKIDFSTEDSSLGGKTLVSILFYARIFCSFSFHPLSSLLFISSCTNVYAAKHTRRSTTILLLIFANRVWENMAKIKY